MPIYEYQCQQCGRRNETLQRMADPPLTTCEVCGGPLKRLISKSAVQFKGSGWYVSDYGKKGGGAAKSEGGESKGGSEAAKSESAGGESKPAASGGAGEGSTSGASPSSG